MCTNYTPATPAHLIAMSGLGVVQWPRADWPRETYPGFLAPIVVAGTGAGPVCEVARFGLVPRWCRDARQASDLSRRTYNARSETVGEKPSYRAPWRERRYALVPMDNFYEPCWEDSAQHGGRSVRWRLALADGAPFVAAGLHERWTDKSTGEIVTSFTLLTVNADNHPLMRRMHRPGDEKRMLVIVPPAQCGAWLRATPDEASALVQAASAPDLVGEPAPRGAAPEQAGDPPPGVQARLL